MHTKRVRRSGFTLVEIMIVVAIIGLLAAIAIPNFLRARVKSQQNACISNLRQIDGAVQQWALENKAAENDPVTVPDVKPYLGRGGGNIDTILCPSAGALVVTFIASYTISTVNVAPICITGAGFPLPHSLQ